MLIFEVNMRFDTGCNRCKNSVEHRLNQLNLEASASQPDTTDFSTEVACAQGAEVLLLSLKVKVTFRSIFLFFFYF